jgi:RimJ/RimL family protein N-acetyltransferase
LSGSRHRIDDDREKIAVGINIPPIGARGKGFGENALTLFMKYLFSADTDNGYAEIYLFLIY